MGMKGFLRITLINTLIAVLVLLVIMGYMRNPRLDRMVWPFAISWTYSFVIGFLCWLVIPRVGPRLLGGPKSRWLMMTLLLIFLGWSGGTIAYLFMVYQPFLTISGIDYRQSMVTCIIFTVAIGIITSVVEQAKARVQATTLELRTRELERERALKAASEAKLKSLESRVHPHFLFNTLNSISSLVRTDPELAENLIERLAALLRFSLDKHGSLVQLSDEIRITRDYLEIEKARFGDRLRYSFDVSEDLLIAKVPALAIQTLAENSVKYAVGAQRAGASIRIRAWREKDAVYFEVSDSGPGFSPESLPAGHGLDTLRQRLDTLFGERASLSARRLSPGMEVAFRIPC
jgi:two-component system LytT family sensor kinase